MRTIRMWEGSVPEDDGTGFVRASQEIQKASQEPPPHAEASPEVPHELPGVQQFPSADKHKFTGSCHFAARLVIWQAGKEVQLPRQTTPGYSSTLIPTRHCLQVCLKESMMEGHLDPDCSRHKLDFIVSKGYCTHSFVAEKL